MEVALMERERLSVPAQRLKEHVIKSSTGDDYRTPGVAGALAA
jgi:hypothetical protein